MILIAIVFVSGRAHYFSTSVPKFHLFSSDAIWWWNYQAYLENEDIFANNIYSIERDSFRFPLNIIAEKLIVQVHREFHIPRISVNLFVSTFIYLFTFILLYFLGLSVMREHKWGCFFALLVSQSTYVAWLRYPVFVPKMLGFMAFPLVLSAFIRTMDERQGYLWLGLIFIAAFLLYPVSVVYYTPILFISGLIYYGLSLDKEIKIDRRALGRYLGFFGLVAIGMFFLRYLMKTPSPPPMQITEYYYQNQHFKFPGTFFEYVKIYGDYYLLSIASLLAIFKIGKGSVARKALLLFFISSGCLFGALISHILAVHVDTIRMLWYWRLAYYSYVPLLLVIVMGIYQLYVSSYQRSRKDRIFVWLLAISIFFWVAYRTPVLTTTAKGTMRTYKELRNGRIIDEYERHMSGLWAFAKQTPKESFFLMPHRRYQNSYTDVFEAEAKRRCLLSRNERYLMIVESELTGTYYKMLKEYDRIEGLDDGEEYSDSLIRLAKVMNATYIIHPRHPQRHRFQIYLPSIYEDYFWSVYQLN